MPISSLPTMNGAAEFSSCQRYRYSLAREWDASKPRLLWIMLNPSTADALVFDPTVRRCASFALGWGFGSFEVANIFALRSTDPRALYTSDDPIGPDNDSEIVEACDRASCVVAAWGVHGAYRDRGASVAQRIAGLGVPLWCLGRTKEGHPRHPLYVSGVTARERYA